MALPFEKKFVIDLILTLQAQRGYFDIMNNEKVAISRKVNSRC